MLNSVSRCALWYFPGFCAISALLVGTSSARATDVVSISEHWTLQVGGPDLARCAPQVSMVMSPVENLNDDYFIFTLNHWSIPDFQPGGVQVQHFCGGEPVAAKQGPQESGLSHDNETVSWVQTLSIEGENLVFEITDGVSQSWGTFGGQGYLKLSQPTSLQRLNGYRPGVSINESGIGYAGNRVASLILTRLEWITSDGTVHEMVAPIDIDADLDP